MIGLLNTLGQDAAEGGAASVPGWLPWALVASGGVLLAVVAVALLRGRAGGTAGSSSRAGEARAELAELQSRLVEVKRLAATVADDLDRRAERLERLIAQADELLDRSTPPGPTAKDRPRGGSVAPPVDDLALRVFALADEGRSPVQIAQALRQPIGNIELMLALRGER